MPKYGNKFECRGLWPVELSPSRSTIEAAAEATAAPLRRAGHVKQKNVQRLEKTAPSHRLNIISPLLLMSFWSELCAAATQGSLSNYQAKLQALTGARALAPCEVFCKIYDVLCAKMLQ